MIDYVDNLLRKQTRIDRVTNETGATDPVIDFEVAMIIPCHCRNPVALFEPAALQGIGKLPRTADNLAPTASVQRVVARHRYYLALPVKPLCVLCNARNQQRRIHHQAIHLTLLPTQKSRTSGTIYQNCSKLRI